MVGVPVGNGPIRPGIPTEISLLRGGMSRKTDGSRGVRIDRQAGERPLSGHIRALPERWARLEAAAAGSLLTADRLAVELAMEASDRRERSATEAEIRLPRSAMVTARATVRDMEKAGRGDEIEEIGRAISRIAPEWPEAENREDGRAGAYSGRTSDRDEETVEFPSLTIAIPFDPEIALSLFPDGFRCRGEDPVRVCPAIAIEFLERRRPCQSNSPRRRAPRARPVDREGAFGVG